MGVGVGGAWRRPSSTAAGTITIASEARNQRRPASVPSPSAWAIESTHTSGSGASLHVAGEMFILATNVRISRVPYKSTGPALLGLLTNEVHMVFATPGGALSHIKDGRLKALAVTSAQPSPLIPGVPTLASQGLKDYDLDTIGFIMAPAKTPPHLIRRLNGHVVQIMSQPDVKERMAGGGSEVVTVTPEQLAAKLRYDDSRMRKLFRQIGLTPDK